MDLSCDSIKRRRLQMTHAGGDTARLTIPGHTGPYWQYLLQIGRNMTEYYQNRPEPE